MRLILLLALFACSFEAQSDEIFPVNKEAKWGDKSYDDSQSEQQPTTIPIAPVINQTPAVKLKKESSGNPDQSKQETEKPFWKKTRDDPIAAFTLAIASFTGVLILVGYCQARELRKTVNAMHREFIATHRPRMRIKFVKPEEESEYEYAD